MTKKSHKPRHRKNPLEVFFLLIIFIVVAFGVAAVLFKLFPTDQSRPLDDTGTTIATKDTEPATAVKTQDDLTPAIATPVQNDGEDPNTLANLTGNITTARTSGSNFVIRVNIDQYLESGSCALTMTSGENSYSISAGIVSSASTSTCEGFDVPLSTLAPGTWKVSIVLASGGKSGTIFGEYQL